MTITQEDLQKAIAKEISKFLDEHRGEIVKRAMEHLKRKEAEANEPKVK